MLAAAFLLIIAVVVVIAEDNEAQWSYSDDAGYSPSQWAVVGFDDDGVTNECDGSAQSPIQIPETTHCNAYADYKPSANCWVDNMEFSVTDHNVMATIVDPTQCSMSGLTDDDHDENIEWNLISIHAHLGWEHRTGTIERCCFQPQSEVHLIHQSSFDDSLMVVAVWLEAAETGDQQQQQQSHVIFDYFLDQWNDLTDTYSDCQDDGDDDDGNERRRLDSTEEDLLNIYDILPRNSDFYAYNGSLTTPPCTEGVTWRVLDQTVRISMSQFLSLQDLITGYRDADTCERLTVANLDWNRTTRPTMPLNGRLVYHVCPMKTRQKLISFWLFGLAAVGAGAMALMWRHRKVVGDSNQQPLILTSTETELSEPT